MAQPQFSLRALLAAVAFLGIGAALWIAKPSWQVGAIETPIVAWVPASLIFLIANSTGRARAWWIGIAAGCMPALFFFLFFFLQTFTGPVRLSSVSWVKIWIFEELSNQFPFLLLAWAFAPVVGLLCVLTHWLLVRPASAEPKD